VCVCLECNIQVLFGDLHATETPGQFTWRPGILTVVRTAFLSFISPNFFPLQAAQSGAWVLFEDLPLARGDVLTAITRLHEDRHIVTDASGTPVAVDDNFHMFATIRYGVCSICNYIGTVIGRAWVRR
jgi:midasin (ATPase involved in ribosome maturation)